MNLSVILAKVTAFALADNNISLDFIGKFIGWLIGITGSVGVGIILFTLALRIIVLPFDIYSKIKTKKNSMKMREMKGDLEKLQKQYANDKNLYNQKMLALQKKNGYSPLSGCLPMILSLVIFIIAINSFRMYSAFSMQNEYNDIITNYNASLERVVESEKYSSVFTKREDGIYVDSTSFYNSVFEVYPEMSDYSSVVKEEGGSVVLRIDENFRFTDEKSTAFLEGIKDDLGTYSGYLQKGESDTVYKLDLRGETDEDKKKETDGFTQTVIDIVENGFINNKILAVVNAEVKEAYESGKIKKSSFLWVKNIWMPDVHYEHPIVSTAEGFQSKISSAARKSCTCDNTMLPVDSAVYDSVTAGLYEQKKQANGYYVMVALSILTMFLSQFVMQKMQKDQIELQSVEGANGQAAMTQKMMMWMMPVMFGFFAFSYSTAFSIYMTVSSVVTTVSSVLINIFVERKLQSEKDKTENQAVGRSKKDINRIEKERAAAEEEARKKQEERLNKSKKNKKE